MKENVSGCFFSEHSVDRRRRDERRRQVVMWPPEREDLVIVNQAQVTQQSCMHYRQRQFRRNYRRA